MQWLITFDPMVTEPGGHLGKCFLCAVVLSRPCLSARSFAFNNVIGNRYILQALQLRHEAGIHEYPVLGFLGFCLKGFVVENLNLTPLKIDLIPAKRVYFLTSQSCA